MRHILLVILSIGYFSVFSQSVSDLKSQLKFCKQESGKFESDLATYKSLLEIQGDQILELKLQLQEQESQIKNLEAKNENLEAISIDLLELGMGYEENGKTEEAIEIYKLLMRSYPHSMDAISARMKIIDLKKKKKAETVGKK